MTARVPTPRELAELREWGWSAPDPCGRVRDPMRRRVYLWWDALKTIAKDRARGDLP